MTTSTVNIEVRTKGQRALDRLANSFKKVETSAKKLERSVGVNLARSLTKVGRSARDLSGNLNRVAGGLRGLAGAVAGIGIGNELRKAADKAARFSAVQKRLELVTASYTQFIGIQDAATASAKKFGLSGLAAAEGYASLAQRLGASGASLSDISDVFDGFNTVLALNGTTAQEAASAQLQLAQALGSGRLAGEEFNAISEATPQVLDEVAKQLNVSRGELKKLASDGKITAKVLVDSLKKIKTDGAEDLAEALKTPAGQIRVFQSAISDLQVAIGQQLLPVIVPFLQVLTKLAQKFGELPGPIKAVAVGVVAVAAAALLALPAVAGLATAIAALAAPAVAVAAVAVLKFAAIAAAVAGVVAAVVALTKVFPGLGSAIQRAFSQVLTFLGGFVNGFINGTQGIKTQWARLTRNIASVWESVIKFLSDAWNKVVNFITGLWEKASNFLQQNFGFIYTAFAQVANALVEAWNFAMAKLPELTKAAVAGIINALGPVTGLLKAAGFDLGAAVADGIEFGFAALEKIPEEIETKVGGGGSNFQSQLGLQGPGDGDGDGDGGDGGKGRKSRLPELQAELATAKELFAIDQKIAAAQLAGNKELENDLQLRRVTLETEGKIAQVLLEEIPPAEKLAKIAALEVAAQKQRLDLNTANTQAIQDQAKAREQALQGLTTDLDLQIAAASAITDEQKRAVQIMEIENSLKERGITLTEDEKASIAGKLQTLDQVKAKTAEIVAQQELLNQLGQDIRSTLESALVDTITSAIDGTKDLNEILSDTLKQVGKLLIQAGVKSISGGIFGFADGGIAQAGKPALVGEKGPELITPLSPTLVSPFDATREAVANSAQDITAEDAFSDNAAVLGATAAISADRAADAKQAEMIASSGGTMNIETTVINSVEYATVDQVQKAAMGAAKSAQAKVLGDLRNKPALRGRVGL